MRSSVIAAKSRTTSRPPGCSAPASCRIMWRHILPNALAPFVVVLTIALGTFIAAEATLSFLGIGLQAAGDLLGHRHRRRPAGTCARRRSRWSCPSVFLALTVLAFIMLGDAIRDAFDPKLR